MKSFLFLFILLAVSSAQAHVTANPDQGEAGEYFQTSFRVSHGCDGADTDRVTIKLPPGFMTVKPQFKPGWQVTFKMRKLDKPVSSGHGKMVNEEFAEVTWRGGPLPDSQYDEFGLLVKLPDMAQKISFPVIQSCKGEKVEWSEIPTGNQKWHDLKHPAPFIDIISLDNNAGHPHSH